MERGKIVINGADELYKAKRMADCKESDKDLIYEAMKTDYKWLKENAEDILDGGKKT